MATKKKKSNAGRKSKYETLLEDDLLIKVEGWARDGLIDEQIAKNIGIAKTTFYEWKKKYKEFANALKRTKEIADREVENALYKSALGYFYNEDTFEEVYNPKTGDNEIRLVKRVRKWQTPSNTAQIFWLKNRKPDEWREKPNPVDNQQTESDGFEEALNATTDEVWDGEEENGDS